MLRRACEFVVTFTFHNTPPDRRLPGTNYDEPKILFGFQGRDADNPDGNFHCCNKGATGEIASSGAADIVHCFHAEATHSHARG